MVVFFNIAASVRQSTDIYIDSSLSICTLLDVSLQNLKTSLSHT